MSLPFVMNAIVIEGDGGGPDVLRMEQRAIPRPGPEQVLVEVSHAGVNRPDVLQRKGLYPPPPGASDIPGLEIAGRVAAVGERVDKARIGTLVCALVTGGGYAEYCLANAAHCLDVPAGMPMAEAAALPETMFTVWHNMFERGFVRDGETVLVHGGTSGIGSMAIKLGKIFDVRMIVTCGSEAKCQAALALGADYAINYNAADFVAEVNRLTNKAGVDCVLDMVAGDYTQRNLDCLATDGRLVTIAVLGGAKATINMAGVMMKRQMLTGSTLRARSDAFKAVLASEILDNVWPFVEEGTLRPALDIVLPLAEVAEAHRRMEAGEHVGKIVLAVRET